MNCKVLDLHTWVFHILLVLAMYQEMAIKQREKLQLKKGKRRKLRKKKDANGAESDDPLDQSVVVVFLAASWKYTLGGVCSLLPSPCSFLARIWSCEQEQ